MKKFAEIDVTSLEVLDEVIDNGVIRVVIEQELEQGDIEAVIGAVGYAQKEHIRAKDSEVGIIDQFMFGNHTILDVAVPFSASPSSKLYERIGDFLSASKNYIQNGKRHIASNTMLGDLGSNVGVKFYVETESKPYNYFMVKVKTRGSINDVKRLFLNYPNDFEIASIKVAKK